jgi:hypothetical protein
MKLELYDDIYDRPVEYVRQIQPQYPDEPSQVQLTPTLNEIVREYLDQDQEDRKE